jgi:hypothetical protein
LEYQNLPLLASVVCNCALKKGYNKLKKIKINEEFLELIKTIQLIIAILYLFFSFLPTDSIKKIIPYGIEIDKLLVIFASIYIINYLFEFLAKYFGNKIGILAKLIEIIIGTIFIFLLDFIPFLIDLKNNQFTFIVGWMLIILYSLKILLTFVIQPITNLYFMIRFKINDIDYKNKLKKIEEEKNIKLKEIDLEYEKKMKELNNNYKV